MGNSCAIWTKAHDSFTSQDKELGQIVIGTSIIIIICECNRTILGNVLLIEIKMLKLTDCPSNDPKSHVWKGEGNKVILTLKNAYILFYLIVTISRVIVKTDALATFPSQDKFSREDAIESMTNITNPSMISTNKKQITDSSHSESPVALAETSSTTMTPATGKTDRIDDNLCILSTVTRRTLIEPVTELTERAVTCSRVEEKNYQQIVSSIYSKDNLNLQQIEISESQSTVVLSAVELFCDYYDCAKLTVFNISGQRVHDFSKLNYWISSWPHLEILDLSNTSLDATESILDADSNSTKPKTVLGNLTTLILDYNNITEINFNYIFERIPKLKHLSLVNNSIFNVICNENLRSRLRTQFETINLAGNSINCEKSQLWFMKQFQNPNIYLKYPEYDKINCSTPERLADMTWSQRLSVLETSTCDRCECKSIKRTAISVDCHNKNWTRLPDVLPINTRILNLTSNRINTLELPYNSKNWENVTYVYLENNLISSFQPLETNSIFMRNLAALDIRRNKFQEFPRHIFEQFINLDKVHLSNNPWLCDCEPPTFAFQEWLQRQFHKLGDKEEIMCGISGSDENGVKSHRLRQRLSSKVIYRLSKSELCPQVNPEEPYEWLDIVNIILGITIFLVVTKVTLDYVYQHRTKRLPHFFRLNF